MRFHVLGSGTLLPDPARGSPAHWVALEGYRIQVDCGMGGLRTAAGLGLPWRSLTHLVLTHFHTDHVGELAAILFALKHGSSRGKGDPLTILGPPGLRDHLDALALAHGSFVLDPGFPVMVRELSPGMVFQEPGAGWQLFTTSTRHTDHSLALRFEARDGLVGLTGDTGWEPGLGEFFRGCDVLVSECSQPDDAGMATHLTPRELADIAGQAQPDLLITVHAYPPLVPEEVPNLLARAGYSGRVLPGRDGLGVDLKGGVATIMGAGKSDSLPADPESGPDPGIHR